MSEGKLVRAKAGESLCQIAMRFGFSDCDPLRPLNPGIPTTRGRLEEGEWVRVPPRTERIEGAPTDAKSEFVMKSTELRIRFIFELGRGYGVGVEDGEPRPEHDPERKELAISNYVVDRAGPGTDPGSFPDASFFGYDERASMDPDHFKVQVHAPRLPKSRQEARVNLYAMKPTLYGPPHGPGGAQEIRVAPDHYERVEHTLGAGVDRTLMDVVCKRVPGTDYFRSPYLRLVPTEASKSYRADQTLLMMDYVDELFARDYERYYTEILQQRVEAETLFKACKHGVCGINHMVGLDAARTLHIAFHVIEPEPGTAPADVVEQIREKVYGWTRRIFAPANVRPVIERINVVPYPQNVLSIGNADDKRRGRHASGRKWLPKHATEDKASALEFYVDGWRFEHKPEKGDSPEATADKLIKLMREAHELEDMTYKLKDYKFVKRVMQLRRKRRFNRSRPVDVFVFRPDGSPAKVDDAGSTDRWKAAYGPLTLEEAGPLLDASGHFRVGEPPFHTHAERAIRRTYDVPNCLNFYVLVGAARIAYTNGKTYSGWGPPGNYHEHDTEIGPCAFMTADSLDMSLIIAHEIGHSQMHCGHASWPEKDAPVAGEAQTTELMDSPADAYDAHDMNRHIADAPIVAWYELLERDDDPETPDDIVLVNGSHVVPALGHATTPVRRLHTVGKWHGIVRTGQKVYTAPDVTGMPHSAPEPAPLPAPEGAVA